MIDTEGTEQTLFSYATYYGTAFTSLYSSGIEKASALYTYYTNPDLINTYRENFAKLIIAASVVMVGVSVSTTAIPAFVVKLAAAHTLAYSTRYIANRLAALPGGDPNNEYWKSFAPTLKALSDNITILSSVMFLGSGIGSGLLAATGNHASLVMSSLGVVLARTIGFELNKMKEILFAVKGNDIISGKDIGEILDGKGSNFEFLKKGALATIGVKVLTTALSADFYTSLAIFATFRTFADVLFEKDLTTENFLSKLGDSLHKPLLYALDFVTMSAYDTTSSRFIQTNSIAAAVAKAGYLESYKQVVGDKLKKSLEDLKIQDKLEGLVGVANDCISSISANISKDDIRDKLENLVEVASDCIDSIAANVAHYEVRSNITNLAATTSEYIHSIAVNVAKQVEKHIPDLSISK